MRPFLFFKNPSSGLRVSEGPPHRAPAPTAMSSGLRRAVPWLWELREMQLSRSQVTRGGHREEEERTHTPTLIFAL